MCASSSDPAAASAVFERHDYPAEAISEERRDRPLVVDLDGTLIRSDLLLESLLLLAKRKPLLLPASVSWLSQGRAWFKHRLAQEAEPDIATLPYDDALIAFLRNEKKKGREVVLATGADERLARKIAAHLDLFDRVYASNGVINLAGAVKRDLLVSEYQRLGFDYIGNGGDDHIVRAAARTAVHPNGEAMPKSDGTAAHSSEANAILKALRPQQWLKNLLVFTPLVLAHRWDNPELLMRAIVAFVAFSLCASGGYLFNDLLDLPSDRHHPHKKWRPLASGELQTAHGLVLMLALPAAGVALALLLPGQFLLALIAYYAGTLTYSLRLKDAIVLDILTLAGLYTLRAVAGALATGLSLPAWILTFFTFVFFSLALLKRYAELLTMHAIDGSRTHARAYRYEDRELLGALGVSAGVGAVLTLDIHIGGRGAGWLQLAWLDCPLLLYAIAYLWLMAHRGRIVDDPLAFALSDNTCRILMLMVPAVFIATAQP